MKGNKCQYVKLNTPLKRNNNYLCINWNARGVKTMRTVPCKSLSKTEKYK